MQAEIGFSREMEVLVKLKELCLTGMFEENYRK